jgi:hypothetical protein
MTRQDFEAVNGVGKVVRTFGDLALAKAWVKEHQETFPGLHVEEVTRSETRRRVYVPRVSLAVISGRAA